MFALNSELNDEILKILRAQFGHSTQIQEVTRLTDPERRNLVLRLRLSCDTEYPRTLILKQSSIEKDKDEEQQGRFARDWAGLQFSSNVPEGKRVTPKFYGGSLKHHFILQEDFGAKHQSLIEPLTSNDKNAAIKALSLYMQKMAQLHANGIRRTEIFENDLHAIHSTSKASHVNPEELMTETKKALKILGLELSDAIYREMEIIFDIVLKNPGPFKTLIHGDICPDNLFYEEQNGDLNFIDFEWSMLGNALIDSAYIRMSMPTGWCVKAFTLADIESLEQIYKNELRKLSPENFDDVQFNHALTAACAYWIIVQTAFIMHEVMENERDVFNDNRAQPHKNWQPKDNLKRPQCLYRLQAFIDIATKYDYFPELKNMAIQVLQQLTVRWGETKKLDVYPAFETTEIKSATTPFEKSLLSPAITSGRNANCFFQSFMHVFTRLSDKTLMQLLQDEKYQLPLQFLVENFNQIYANLLPKALNIQEIILFSKSLHPLDREFIFGPVLRATYNSLVAAKLIQTEYLGLSDSDIVLSNQTVAFANCFGARLSVYMSEEELDKARQSGMPTDVADRISMQKIVVDNATFVCDRSDNQPNLWELNLVYAGVHLNYTHGTPELNEHERHQVFIRPSNFGADFAAGPANPNDAPLASANKDVLDFRMAKLFGQISVAPNLMELLSTNTTFFRDHENKFLQEHRHDDPNIQHEYDKRFGLVLK